MATAKKGKKNKGKTLALVDFLQETPGAIPSMPIRKSSTSWADDVEDSHDMYESRSSKAANVVLPTAPKASRDFDDFIDKVPMSGPYTAYISNLPYDIDESEITYFFKNMKIESLRLPKDDRPGEGPKLKGYGYVEFEDRDSLLNALVIPDTTIKNRRIRIEIASEADNDKRRGGRMDMSRDRGNRGEAPTGDWRSGPRTESSGEGSERRGFSRDNRDRDNRDDNTSGAWRSSNRDRDMDRDRSDRPFTRSEQRPSAFSRDDRDRDQDYNRPRGGGGGGGGRDDDSRFVRRSYGGDRDGGDRDRDRGGDRRGGMMERSDRMMDRSERMMDRSGMVERNGGGGGGGGGGYSRGPPPSRSSGDDSESTSRSSEPRQRPKLVLAPRSKTVENEPAEKVASSGANIFGNAKPVDTSARERQIEERLAKEHDGPAPRRELSRERRGPSPREEKEQEITREEKLDDPEPEPEPEKKPLERTSSSSSQKSETNGVVDKSHQARKNGDQEKREHVKSDEKLHSKADNNKKREEKKDKAEKEMPKLKQVDPPNFSSSNKFAFLETEDTSD